LIVLHDQLSWFNGNWNLQCGELNSFRHDAGHAGIAPEKGFTRCGNIEGKREVSSDTVDVSLATTPGLVLTSALSSDQADSVSRDQLAMASDLRAPMTEVNVETGIPASMREK
jgi:hypothetical protein